MFRVWHMSLTSCSRSLYKDLAICTRGSLLSIRGRPPIRPRARAVDRPARVRSCISRGSNGASAEKMLKTSSPGAVVISIALSQIERKPIPCSRSFSTSVTRCGIERPKRSKRQDAYDLLVPVYGWFTEGFDTADLQDAKIFLEALQSYIDRRVKRDPFSPCMLKALKATL